MDRQTLERLAANPHYKMTPQQIAELNRLRAGDQVEHDPGFQTHDTGFRSHPTGPRRQGGADNRAGDTASGS